MKNFYGFTDAFCRRFRGIRLSSSNKTSSSSWLSFKAKRILLKKSPVRRILPIIICGAGRHLLKLFRRQRSLNAAKLYKTMQLKASSLVGKSNTRISKDFSLIPLLRHESMSLLECQVLQKNTYLNSVRRNDRRSSIVTVDGLCSFCWICYN